MKTIGNRVGGDADVARSNYGNQGQRMSAAVGICTNSMRGLRAVMTGWLIGQKSDDVRPAARQVAGAQQDRQRRRRKAERCHQSEAS